MKFAISEEDLEEQRQADKDNEYEMNEEEKKRFDSFSDWFTEDYKKDVEKEY